MSMKTFNVYRSILSSDPDGHQTLQKIAQITADEYHTAYTRATFIRNFYTWDGQPGSVIDDVNDQPEHELASHIPMIRASHYCNECLQRQQRLIEQEIEQHDRRLTMLKETYESMLATM